MAASPAGHHVVAELDVAPGRSWGSGPSWAGRLAVGLWGSWRAWHVSSGDPRAEGRGARHCPRERHGVRIRPSCARISMTKPGPYDSRCSSYLLAELKAAGGPRGAVVPRSAWTSGSDRGQRVIALPVALESPACSLPGPWQLSHWTFDFAAVFGWRRRMSLENRAGRSLRWWLRRPSRRWTWPRPAQPIERESIVLGAEVEEVTHRFLAGSRYRTDSPGPDLGKHRRVMGLLPGVGEVLEPGRLARMAGRALPTKGSGTCSALPTPAYFCRRCRHVATWLLIVPSLWIRSISSPTRSGTK